MTIHNNLNIIHTAMHTKLPRYINEDIKFEDTFMDIQQYPAQTRHNYKLFNYLKYSPQNYH